jgi:hypothetical protein
MSPTFIGLLFFTMALMVFWRAALLVLGAILITAVVMGLGLVAEAPAAAGSSSHVLEQPLDHVPTQTAVPVR